MVLAMQFTQLAACNGLHDVEERLARLADDESHDRIDLETMPLTQEFLGQMLGTRRSSVSMAASILQKAGMITCTRGNVTILDRGKLAEAACDCYQIIQRQKSNWQAAPTFAVFEWLNEYVEVASFAQIGDCELTSAQITYDIMDFSNLAYLTLFPKAAL